LILETKDNIEDFVLPVSYLLRAMPVLQWPGNKLPYMTEKFGMVLYMYQVMSSLWLL